MTVLEYGNSPTTNAPADAAAPETELVSSVTQEGSVASDRTIEVRDPSVFPKTTAPNTSGPVSTEADSATRLQALLGMGSEIVAHSERRTDETLRPFPDDLNEFLRREHESL
jgi:hypothetical protein